MKMSAACFLVSHVKDLYVDSNKDSPELYRIVSIISPWFMEIINICQVQF